MDSVALVCQALGTAWLSCPDPSQTGVWAGIQLLHSAHPDSVVSWGMSQFQDQALSLVGLGIWRLCWAQCLGRFCYTQHQCLQSCWHQTPANMLLPEAFAPQGPSAYLPVMQMELLKQPGLASLVLTLPCAHDLWGSAPRFCSCLPGKSCLHIFVCDFMWLCVWGKDPGAEGMCGSHQVYLYVQLQMPSAMNCCLCRCGQAFTDPWSHEWLEVHLCWAGVFALCSCACHRCVSGSLCEPSSLSRCFWGLVGMDEEGAGPFPMSTHTCCEPEVAARRVQEKTPASLHGANPTLCLPAAPPLTAPLKGLRSSVVLLLHNNSAALITTSPLKPSSSPSSPFLCPAPFEPCRQ